MGWGVDDSSHYSALLEQQLRRRTQDDRIRVLSAGVNAYPFVSCVERMEVLLEEGLQIDLAILAYSFNHKFSQFSQLKGKDKQEFLQKVRLKSVVRRFALYNFFIEDLLRSAVYYRVRSRLAKGSWRKLGQPLGADENLDIHDEATQKAVKLARQYKVDIVMLLLRIPRSER